ncbi:DUF3152 domain-containing protein [Saccharopolyspora griseoalba]|uniref:DUF3152 domain-containing protein n=1 Tax=Saccharopolyspora griseoalba TaxID=1431848 RepID=A0ABW2LKT7_9PSEU
MHDHRFPGSDAERAEQHQRGEPLAASWRPAEREQPKHRIRKRRRYGWQVYALPLLVVITALVVFQTVRPDDFDATLSGASSPLDGGEPLGARDAGGNAPPAVTEAPTKQRYPSDMFDADLPPGAPIPKTGARTFQVLPGGSPVVGQGQLYRYTVEVEVGMDLPDPETEFGHMVQTTLSDPRSWTNPKAGGISLQRVGEDADPDFRVILVSQDSARVLCGYSAGVPYDSSCRKGEMVYINAARWVRGAKAFEGDIGNYRRYAINHEVGHAFGNGHVGCPAPGALAPVMMQQTFSASNNVLHELNQVADQGTKIAADGFVCKPNAWPFPVIAPS